MSRSKPPATLAYPVGIWGPVTATLDWCEANYQFSHYIAEMANTVSNLVSIVLALHGAKSVWEQGFPMRCLVGFLAFATVGFGSFAFHATLRYSAQLADELPMIYSCACSLFMLYDTTPGHGLQRSARAKALIAGLVAFNVLFTWSYWVYRNPVYHQVVFGALLLLIGVRARYLLSSPRSFAPIPLQTRATISRLYYQGSGLFLLGFLIWNLDNIYCDTLTHWKFGLTWPTAFLLEGHSWWHIFTGAGSYLMWMGTTYLTVCMKDNPNNYALKYTYGYLPHVQYVGKAKA